MKKKQTKKIQHTIYLTEDLADYIRDQASKAQVSMSDIVSAFLKEMKGDYIPPYLIVQNHLKIIKACVQRLNNENIEECRSIEEDISCRKYLGELEENLKDLKEELIKKNSRKATYAQILSSIETIEEKIKYI